MSYNLFGNSLQNNNFLSQFYGANRFSNMTVRGASSEEDKSAAAAAKDKSADKTTDKTAVANKKTAVTAVDEAEDTTAVATTAEDDDSTLSFFDEFKKQLNDVLLGSVGLDNLSNMAQGGVSAYSMSAQFEINLQVMQAVSDANGTTYTQQSFSLSASFEFMGISSGMGSGFDLSSIFGGGDTANTGQDGVVSPDGTTQTDKNDPLAKLKDLFSPEKTAQRILDFALSFFGKSSAYKTGGDTEESRGSFADMMGKAIQKGFDQALGILGELPEETANEIDQTHGLVFDGLDNFVQNGNDRSKDNLYSSIQAYQSTFELNYSSTSIYYSADEWNQLMSDRSANQKQIQDAQSAYQNSSAATAGEATAEDVADEAGSAVNVEV